MKILVTGGTGMVGSCFEKYEDDGVIRVGSSDCNLMDESECDRLFRDIKPDSVIHLAARVGGVKGNTDYMGDFYFQNIKINTNVLEFARVYNVKKVVSLLSTCIYPDDVIYPLTEDQIHNGPPHASNFGYAYAKRMLDIQSKAYRQQYDCNFITAVPNNLFGENDNFDLENSHVIPAIIRKVYEAKNSNKPYITLWGDGTPLREFTYSQDIADILLVLLKRYNGADPVNIGNTGEIPIREVANKISRYLRYEGEIRWDTSMPSGQFRKPSSNDKFLDLNYWASGRYTSFDHGIKKTCEWFENAYPKIRGI